MRLSYMVIIVLHFLSICSSEMPGNDHKTKRISNSFSRLQRSKRKLSRNLIRFRYVPLIEEQVKHAVDEIVNRSISFFQRLASNARCGTLLKPPGKFKEPISQLSLNSLKKPQLNSMTDIKEKQYIREIIAALKDYEKRSYDLSKKEMQTPTKFNVGYREAWRKRRRRITKLANEFDNDSIVGRKSTFLKNFPKLLRRKKKFGSFMKKFKTNRAKFNDFRVIKILMDLKIRAEGLKCNILFQKKCANVANISQARLLRFTCDNKFANKMGEIYFNVDAHSSILSYFSRQVELDFSSLQTVNEDDSIIKKGSYNSKKLKKWTSRVSKKLGEAFPRYSFGVAIWQHGLESDDVTVSRWTQIRLHMGKFLVTKERISAMVVWREKDIAYNPLHYIWNTEFDEMMNYSMNITMQGNNGKHVVKRVKDWIDNERATRKPFDLYFYWILIIKDDIRHSVGTTENMELRTYLPSMQSRAVRATQGNTFLSKYRLYFAF